MTLLFAELVRNQRHLGPGTYRTALISVGNDALINDGRNSLAVEPDSFPVRSRELMLQLFLGAIRVDPLADSHIRSTGATAQSGRADCRKRWIAHTGPYSLPAPYPYRPRDRRFLGSPARVLHSERRPLRPGIGRLWS